MTCNLDPIDSFLAVTDYSATSPRTMNNSAGQKGFAPHNLIAPSEDFSDSNWVKTNTTVTSNAAAAPDGTITADKISHDDTTASLYQNSTVVSGQSYGVGVFLKYVDNQWAYVEEDFTNKTWIDLQNKTIGTDNIGTVTLTELSDDWLYVWFSATAGDTTFSLSVHLTGSDNSSVEAAGTSAYIWGAHLYENGLAGMFDVPEDQRALASLTKYLPNKAVVTGPNLVSNGTFDSNTNGWTASNSTLSVVSNKLRVTVSSNGIGEAYQAITTVVGKHYKVSGGLSNPAGPANDAGIKVGTSATGNQLGQYWQTAAETEVSHYFTATGTTTYITLAVSFDAGDYVDFDNITVTKVDRDPTAARFLPRRGNHEYIDGAWVKGLKAESEARTNLCTDAFEWTGVFQATLTANSTTGPSGLTDMQKLTEDTTASSQHQTSIAETLSATTAYTTSAVFKAGTRDHFQIYVTSPGMTDAYAAIDLTDGSIHSSGGCTPVVEDLGSGFYRLAVPFTTVTGGSSTVRLQLHNGTTHLYTGDGSSYAYCGYVQLEAGSTPSSLIPTYGATRTRTAETFTQKSDKIIWPNTTYVDGTELWDDTGVSVGTSWTDNGDGSYTFGASGTDTFRDNIGLSSSSVYEITYTVSGRTAGTIYPVSGGSINGVSQNTNGTFTDVLVGGSNALLYFQPDASFDGTVGSISVKEINPRALAVVMHGYMTYADTGSYNEAFFLRQFDGSSNGVFMYLDTFGTNVGRVYSQSKANGIDDFAATATDTYSPGINVPFKIASRYLDNAIQGAADGTATTENTTPPGLPDLSATQTEWFYEFMGHISFVGVGQEASADRLDSTNGPTTLTTATGGSFLA